MHKITKGLKKKKKTKKHKKEEELFDEAELEQYRKEHQQQHQESGECDQQEPSEQDGAENEEWKRFKALTAGVDSVLKKTEEDLNRIKSTSFFQRKPPGPSTSVPVTKQAPARPAPPSINSADKKKKAKNWIGFEESSLGIDVAAPEEHIDYGDEATVHTSVDELLGTEATNEEEQEEEEEETEDENADDDIFDTSYIDVVKLAYIPDSPTEEIEEYDPFDTSIAEKVIREEEEQKKSKKNLVSLGCAVEVLTGRLDSTPTLSGKRRRPSPRRPQDIDLLLDDDAGDGYDEKVLNADVEFVTNLLDEPSQPSLLDDEPSLTESNVINVPIALQNKVASEQEKDTEEAKDTDVKNIIAEFDVISEPTEPLSNVVEDIGPKTNVLQEEEDLEDEFAALAAESVSKKASEIEESTSDPFDVTTTVVEGEKLSFPLSPDVDIVLNTDKKSKWTAFDENSGPVTTNSSSIFVEDEGGETAQEDPFDTSFAENIVPGKTEIKLIESELLGDCSVGVIINECKFSYDDLLSKKSEVESLFHTEKENNNEDSSEPRLLTAVHRDLLGGSSTQLNQDPIKPAEQKSLTQDIEDPFDTSIVEEIVAPGKAELKYIEKELLEGIEGTIKRSISDPNFDPRADDTVPTVSVDVPDLLNVKAGVPKIVAFDIPTPSTRPDLLVVGADEESRISKPLTPYYIESKLNDFTYNDNESAAPADPFDTSFVEIPAPGKAELKIIENELVGGLKHSLSDQDFNPRGEEAQLEADNTERAPTLGRRFSDFTGDRRRVPPSTLSIKGVIVSKVPLEIAPAVAIPTFKPDLLAVEEDAPLTAKPLTPAVETTFDYCDPFDTTIASNLVPGRAELKVLESELVSETDETHLQVTASLPRSYTDPDFNPRDDELNSVAESPLEKPDLLNLHSEIIPDTKTLTPQPHSLDQSDINSEEIDPFDTSIASALVPGKAELKFLESEFIGP